MAIKPVDMQVMLPKLYEVARVQGTDLERQALASQRGEIDVKAMVDADIKEVHAKKDAQKVNFREKKDEEGKKKKNSNNKGGNKGEGEHENSSQGNENALSSDAVSCKTERSMFIDIKL